jgi:N6-adenosine-specific RNA methylase IME4
MKHLTLRPIPKPTDAATEIGDLYRRARASVVDSVRYLLEAGTRLTKQKADLPHGQWLPWLAANADVLGFESRFTAAKLMKAAKCVAGGTFDEEQALEVCRKIWGHTPSDDETLRRAVGIRRERYAKKYKKRVQKILQIAKGNSALGVGKTYPVVLADPAWDFDMGTTVNRTTNNHRSPANHYPCMSLEEIIALPVSKLVTPDAVLFLWTTCAHMRVAIQVLEAWEFAYKSHLVWVKESIGLGFWFRNQHEILLVGSRGDMPAPLPENRPASVIRAPRREHSEKPVFVHKLIERMYPGLPKIELFARSQQPGWSVWGNQAKKKVA